MKQQNVNYDKLTGPAILEHPIYLSRHAALQTEINQHKVEKIVFKSESFIIKKEKKNYKVDKEVCKQIVEAIINSKPRMNFTVILTKNYYE